MLGLLDLLYNTFWNYRLNKFCSPPASQEKGQLRLVLGVGRSGTTWIANTLARTKTPIRYFEEPLHHIKPKLRLSNGHDHTCCDTFPTSQRLTTTYQVLRSTQLDSTFLDERFFRRNDHDYNYVLVKEVHALLASLTLAQGLKAQMIFIKRSIPVILDSLFHAQGLDTPYLKDEFTLLRTSQFIEYYFKSSKGSLFSQLDMISTLGHKKRIFFSTALVIYLIQYSFKVISNSCKNAIVVDYGEILLNPEPFAK